VFIGRDGYDLNGNIENLERIRSENHNQRIVAGLNGALAAAGMGCLLSVRPNKVDESRTATTGSWRYRGCDRVTPDRRATNC
jgi:hypothetical protein